MRLGQGPAELGVEARHFLQLGLVDSWRIGDAGYPGVHGVEEVVLMILDWYNDCVVVGEGQEDEVPESWFDEDV